MTGRIDDHEKTYISFPFCACRRHDRRIRKIFHCIIIHFWPVSVCGNLLDMPPQKQRQSITTGESLKHLGKGNIQMYGIFVNERGAGRYATWLVSGVKTIETRNKDMLHELVGKRVAIVKTRDRCLPHYAPMVIGYVTITGKSFCKAEDFDKHFKEHLVSEASAYSCNGKGKWFYYVADAEECDPFTLPADAIRHGRSWCEF